MIQKIKSVFIFSLCFFSISAKSEQNFPLFGHNLTPTTYTLLKNQFTVGNYVIGYGITENFTVATSPWIDIEYNMPMIALKYGQSISDSNRLSGEVLYFKTANYGRNTYDMEAWMLRLGFSRRFNENFTWHNVLHYTHYIRDVAPFSLRLDPGNDHRYTLSVGTLFEVKLTENFGLFQEFGILGLNYYNSYFHWGSSLFYKWSSTYLQFGLSQSSTIRKLGLDANGSPVYQSESVWHPEIQLQYFF